MPFIQLRRTNGRCDDVFTPIFDEEREEIIIMRENFCNARKKRHKRNRRNKGEKLFFLKSRYSTNTTCRLDSTSMNHIAYFSMSFSLNLVFDQDFLIQILCIFFFSLFYFFFRFDIFGKKE
jgi:hypothetical protein